MPTFPPLSLPAHAVPLRQCAAGAWQVYDRLRRRYVALTPEEWVRQHFVEYLIQDLGYPAGLMGNEVSLTLNGTRRRADTLVGDRYGQPLMVVEYKRPDVEVSQRVFDQIVRYNMVLRARYLAVSNGLTHYCCQIDYATQGYRFLPAVPSYADLQTNEKNDEQEG